MAFLGGGCFDLRPGDDDANDPAAFEDEDEGADPTGDDNDPDADREPPTAEEEEQGTEEGEMAVATAAELTGVLEVVAGPETMTASTPEEAQQQWVQAIIAELDECMSEETDGLTWVTITFDQCGDGTAIVVDGELHAQLSLEGEFPNYTAWLATSTLALDVSGIDVDGELVLRDPLDDAERKSWDGQLTVGAPELSPIQFDTTASWITDGQCSELDMTAELSRFLLPWRLDVVDYKGCAGACPESGNVAFELAGFVVGWTYNGDDTVTVTGINGNEWTYPLACE